MRGIGERFQEETKYFRDRMPAGSTARVRPPTPYKEYAGSETFELPAPPPLAQMPLHLALVGRKSTRQFAPIEITLEHLAYLLWASCGIQRREHGFEFRTAPSAGALYPIETYVVVNRVKDVPAGVYHYSVRRHVLETLRRGFAGREVAEAALEQGMCLDAAAVFVWTAIFDRSRWKYGERAFRYVYLDAGHVGENLALAAVALGLGSCQIGAIFDDEMNAIVGVDGASESVIYVSVVGEPRSVER